MKRWLTARFTKNIMERREMHTFKIADSATAQICAFLRWSFPHVLTEEEKSVREEEKRQREEEEEEKKKPNGRDSLWPEGANLEVCESKFGGLKKMKEKYVDDSEMYGKMKDFPIVSILVVVHDKQLFF